MTLTALGAGPWKGVRDTRDPFDLPADPVFLQDAQNCYIPDGNGGSGVYARPGFRNGPSSATAGITQMVVPYTYIPQSGTTYRFVMTNGKLFRFTTAGGDPLAVATDVTPVGVTIDNGTTPTARFYITQHADQLIVSDGVNRPWRGTNLGATPITGTYIDIDGAAGAWTAQGQPVVYQGSLFFICKTVPGGSSVTAGLGLIWSEPNQPATGYTQSGYANFWNLIEQSSLPIYALAATNNTLYYFRAQSIGAVQGTPGSNFSSTATRDLVSAGVGCTAPASIVQFMDNIFFVDRIGRPYLFQPGSAPQELWKQLRGQIDANPTYVTYPAATALVGIGCLASQLNLVLLGGWSSNPTNTSPTTTPLPPTTLYAFDAKDGMYYGRWSLSGSITSSGIAALAEMTDTNGTPLMTAVSNTGTAYKFYTLQALGAAAWTDGEASVNLYVPTINAKTQSLGYSANVVWNATDTGTVITQSTAPVTVTVRTPYTSSTTEITGGTPASSQDGTYRMVFGMDVLEARGIELTMSPTTAASQWVIQRVEFPADSSLATLGDQ